MEDMCVNEMIIINKISEQIIVIKMLEIDTRDEINDSNKIQMILIESNEIKMQ